MNCQDISRVVDSGNIRNLSVAEHSAVESHARSCRECAAIWGVQSQLAGLRVPAAPPQVAAWLRTLAALPDQPVRGRFPRRLILIGSVVAMAAAAALLNFREPGTPVAKAPEVAPIAPAVAEPVPAPVAEVAAKVIAPAAPPEMASRPPEKPVPLLPPPVMPPGPELVSPGLQRAVERHPELVEGPAIEGTFVVGVALKADGSVLTSAIRHAPAGDVAAARAEINALTPGDGGVSQLIPKSNPLPYGRKLRTDVLLQVRSIPDGFDIARSRARVLQILGDKYDYLMAPVSSSGELNRVEVLLSEDGGILRDHVEAVREGSSGTNVTEDPADVARFAEGIAARLGVSVGQIGVVGLTGKTRGPVSIVTDRAGGPPAMQNVPRMLINYAWTRRAGESAPILGGVAPPQGIDQAKALVVAERYVPDAFTTQDPAAGEPVLLLSAKGKFIRAWHLPPQTPQQTSRTLQQTVSRTMQEQLAGGPPVSGWTRLKLTNATGISAYVYFAWQRAGAQNENPAR